ncbi:MAG: MCE family protein [Deltaproteobacteria bacterium]|nr:MCE family protein [Deltaproteobacteria bacterium]
MSKPANKTMIGAFVLGAVVLAVVALVLFGSGRFFRKTETWIAFFPGTVKGLNVGAPVKFRGASVGEVTEIIVNFNAIDLAVNIPVIFELDPSRFRRIGPEVVTGDKAMHQALISHGLRAQLEMQSLVTGQLMINMDFYPDQPATLFGVQNAELGERIEPWQEVPTIPTTLEQLQETLSKINFKKIGEDVSRAADGVAKLATSPELQASVQELKEMLIAIKTLAHNVDSKVEPLASSIDQTLVEARAGIGDTRKVINEQAAPMLVQFRQAAVSAETALDQADKTLKSIENLTDEGTQLRFEISEALEEVSAASRSVRVLADFIEQHPDAILRGRFIQTGGN